MIADHPLTGLGLDSSFTLSRALHHAGCLAGAEFSHPHNFLLVSGCASAYSARWSSRGCNGLLAPSSSPVYDFSANDPLPFALIVGAMGSMGQPVGAWVGG